MFRKIWEFIQIQTQNSISMKKGYFNQQKIGLSREQSYKNVLSSPKKEFELLYRERDNLPASQAFESIIFVKSKKCENKKTTSKTKNGLRSKISKVDELKKVISQLQTQLKAQSKKSRQVEQSKTKASVLKSTTNTNILSQRRQESNINYGKITMRPAKQKKNSALTQQNINKNRNILSPSRKIKNNSVEIHKNSYDVKQNKKTQSCKKAFDVERKYKLEIQNCDQYVLVDDNFVEVSYEQAFALGEKLSSRNKESERLQKYQYCLSNKQNSKVADNSFSPEFQRYIEDDTEKEIGRSEIYSNNEEIFYSNNISVVQKYIVNKVKKIQQWWRKMLKRRHQNQAQQLNPQYQRLKQNFGDQIESQQSIVFENSQNQYKSESSPIKMVSNLINEEGINQNLAFSLTIRENAARGLMETHLKILNSFIANNQISAQTYKQKTQLVHKQYSAEMAEIEQIKSILRNNEKQAFKIQQKAKQDLMMIQRLQSNVDSVLIDKMFGKEGDFLSEGVSSQLRMNRQKSTGCHFNFNQNQVGFYKKETTLGSSLSESDEEISHITPEDETQFYENNTIEQCNSFVTNTNFKQIVQEYKARQAVKMEIDKRVAIQMGAYIQEIPEEIKNQYVGIDTSLTSIHKFLLSFFKFYIYYYKDDFLRLINMPFGFNIQKRIKFLQDYEQESEVDEDEEGVIYGLEFVINDQILEEFFDKIYQFGNNKLTFAQRANMQFQKIHNKAVFDCFNEALNYFRPYFLINGPPYPWNNSEKALTFYFIAQENIQQVFQKTQFKVLKWASNLCGILVNKVAQEHLNQPSKTSQDSNQYGCHPLVHEAREERLGKNQKADLFEASHIWCLCEQEKTSVCLDISSYITDLLFAELIKQKWQVEINNESCFEMQILACDHLVADKQLEEMNEVDSIEQFQFV